MNEIMDFLTSKEIIIVYIVVAVACLLCFIIYLIDKSYDKRKRRQNTRKLNKLVEDVNLRAQEGIDNEDKIKANSVKSDKTLELHSADEPLMIQPEVDFIDKSSDYDFVPIQDDGIVLNYDQNIKQENRVNEVKTVENSQVPLIQEVLDTSIGTNTNYNSMNIEQLQVEASNSIKEAMNEQINKVHDKIEELVYTDPVPDKEQATRELIKLAEELERTEKAQRSGIDISKYETEQEENAIISLDELAKKSEQMYATNEVTQYADEGNEPISLDDLEKRKMQVINSELDLGGASTNVNIENNVINGTNINTNDNVKTINEVNNKQQLQIDVSSTNINNNLSHAYQGNGLMGQEIFSSVFGIEKSAEERQKDEELQKTSEFLLSLKDLQSRLNS